MAAYAEVTGVDNISRQNYTGALQIFDASMCVNPKSSKTLNAYVGKNSAIREKIGIVSYKDSSEQYVSTVIGTYYNSLTSQDVIWYYAKNGELYNSSYYGAHIYRNHDSSGLYYFKDTWSAYYLSDIYNAALIPVYETLEDCLAALRTLPKTAGDQVQVPVRWNNLEASFEITVN